MPRRTNKAKVMPKQRKASGPSCKALKFHSQFNLPRDIPQRFVVDSQVYMIYAFSRVVKSDDDYIIKVTPNSFSESEITPCRNLIWYEPGRFHPDLRGLHIIHVNVKNCRKPPKVRRIYFVPANSAHATFPKNLISHKEVTRKQRSGISIVEGVWYKMHSSF